jgi:hypothetical protein
VVPCLVAVDVAFGKATNMMICNRLNDHWPRFAANSRIERHVTLYCNQSLIEFHPILQAM